MWVENVQMLEHEPQRTSSSHPVVRLRRELRRVEEERNTFFSGLLAVTVVAAVATGAMLAVMMATI